MCCEAVRTAEVGPDALGQARPAGASEFDSVADTALILGLAGIGGTVVVGIASPWIAASLAGKQQARALEHERTTRDEGELRAVLDEIVARLDDCGAAARTVQGRLVMHGRKIGQEQQGTDAIVAVGDANLVLGRTIGRLAIRLGNDHPVRRAALEASNAIGRVVGAAGNIAFMADEADLASHAAEVREGVEEFDRARRAFVDVASAYAGSRLPRQLDLELGFKPGELAERRARGE